MFAIKQRRYALKIIVIYLMVFESDCYEKTLRKIIRDRMKMVQRPFSDTDGSLKWKNMSHVSPKMFRHPGFAQVKSVIHKVQRPKISTILSSVETNKGKSMYSRIKIDDKENVHYNDVRMARDAIVNITTALQRTDSFIFPEFKPQRNDNVSQPANFSLATYSQFPQSNFFPALSEEHLQQEAQTSNSKENNIPQYPKTKESNLLIQGIIRPRSKIEIENTEKKHAIDLNVLDADIDKTDFIIDEVMTKPNLTTYISSQSDIPYTCNAIRETQVDIDFQKLFSELDIEPSWAAKKRFWNQIYQSRYESLMRSSKWPFLKVIVIPRTQVDTIWKKSFEDLHSTTVRKIISNMIKKLQYYSNLTFAWNEVSHLSHWWKTATQKGRAALRRLVKEKRLEITTGGWVETDEATSHLFGLLHQFTEGHQWLQNNLNYSPDVAWLTNSVTHSPTMSYMSSAAGITNLVVTNIHFSFEQYLAEYQHADYIWIQNWESESNSGSKLNKILDKIGNELVPNHSILTHYLQFNSDGLKACGPDTDVCLNEFNFAKFNKNIDINSFNIKDKSQILLEQYSKTGTLSTHNIIMAPIGGPFRFEAQIEFDHQFDNYQKIMEFINTNHDVYKASIEFGTPRDYFRNILKNHKSYPTVKGDLLNFADISSGTPSYWTGFFTSRPHLKILLRRLHSTLRTTEILFSFALSSNVFETYENTTDLLKELLNAREIVARLQDRNVVSGTLTSRALGYVLSKILSTAENCWYIQEVAVSLLSSKPGTNTANLEKYILREREFVSSLKPVAPGDRIYVFNSLSQERTEIVELISQYPNIRIVDHKKIDVSVQINPLWRHTSNNIIISRQFYKILLTIILPPMTFGLYTISNTYDAMLSASTIYCIACIVEEAKSDFPIPFSIQPLETGDIQVENYKNRLLFDEFTGFLRTVVEKSTGRQKPVAIDYGAFKSSRINSGMFLFNTNITRPLVDILLPYKTGDATKLPLIISGPITTEVIVIYDKLLQHTVKIFNTLHTPLDDIIVIESKVDYEVSPKNRELEMFLSFQTDIANGHPLQLFTDNNGFQYTKRYININRRVESNVYPITNMVFIQDNNSRFSVITDHAHGVTALQEGQLVLMLDRRVLYNDKRGTDEGLADNIATTHVNYILLENFEKADFSFDQRFKSQIELPSMTATYHSNALNYNLDVYFVNKNQANLLYYAFLPLLKTPFPCDVSLINYRIVFKDKYFPSTALLSLHRQGYSCRMDYNFMNCNGENSFELVKIFRNVKEAYQTNLVGTNKGVTVKTLNLANFPSMELMTLRVHF